MNTLTRICDDKKAHIAARKAQTPLSVLEEKVLQVTPPLGFKNKISTSAPALIAEVKKASPSKGVIRADFDPVAIAGAYERAGAACLSVLTDEPYFQGCDDYLVSIRETVSLPLLRKDFMLDPFQIIESRALGADCILLIMAALSDSQAKELLDAATALGMDVLVEVHDVTELERALPYSAAAMIGVNNRNLKTLAVDIRTSENLLPMMPSETLKIAESGITGHEELIRLHNLGFSGFLVGESLMKQDDIECAARKLLTGS